LVEVVERAAVVPHQSFVLDRWFLFMKHRMLKRSVSPGEKQAPVRPQAANGRGRSQSFLGAPQSRGCSASGRKLHEAAASQRSLLAECPQQPDVLQLLGVLRHMREDGSTARRGRCAEL
jgi:hypothetical protein